MTIVYVQIASPYGYVGWWSEYGKEYHKLAVDDPQDWYDKLTCCRPAFYELR
jgi:hypothetical protein